MVRKLGEVVCHLNLSRYSFDLGVRESYSRLLFHANKRHLRVREHLEMIRSTFIDLSNIKTAEFIQVC